MKASFLFSGLLVLLLLVRLHAADFTDPGGTDPRVEIADKTSGLSWVPATNALTVSCWFKLSIPSNATLAERCSSLWIAALAARLIRCWSAGITSWSLPYRNLFV
jgi:hypothetical protein